MTILEFMRAISSPAGSTVDRRLVAEVSGHGSPTLQLSNTHQRMGSISLDDDGNVKFVLLADAAPLWVERRIAKAFPEVPIK